MTSLKTLLARREALQRIQASTFRLMYGNLVPSRPIARRIGTLNLKIEAARRALK